MLKLTEAGLLTGQEPFMQWSCKDATNPPNCVELNLLRRNIIMQLGKVRSGFLFTLTKVTPSTYGVELQRNHGKIYRTRSSSARLRCPDLRNL